MCAAGSAEKLRKYRQPWWQEGRARPWASRKPCGLASAQPLSGGIKLGVMVGWGLGGGPSASGLCWRAQHRNHDSISMQKECYCKTELRLILENSKTQRRHKALISYLTRERRLKARLIIII